MMKVYLAGPMSGRKEFNYPAFHNVARDLRAHGYVVENPAENEAPPCGSWGGYLRIALRQMLSCDGIVLLPGWSFSRGACLERSVGESVGIPSWTLAEFLETSKTVPPWERPQILLDAEPAESDPGQMPAPTPAPDIPAFLLKDGPHPLAGDPIEMQTFGPLHSAEPAPTPATKPTNPKDAIGIRKAPMSCVPCGVLAEIGVGMLEGASKYGRHNYRAVGVRASVYYDATMRHLMSWWEGEDIDPDSGMSHIAKAITSLVVLRDAMMQGKVADDRPPRSVPFYPGLNALAGVVLDRHADKSPKHWTLDDEQLDQDDREAA